MKMDPTGKDALLSAKWTGGESWSPTSLLRHSRRSNRKTASGSSRETGGEFVPTPRTVCPNPASYRLAPDSPPTSSFCALFQGCSARSRPGRAPCEPGHASGEEATQRCSHPSR
jgi:hypothetical protein